VQEKRDVTPQVGREVFEFLTSQMCSPHLVAGHQRARSVGRPAGHPAGHRDDFADGETGAALHSGGVAQQPRGTDREVVVVGRHVDRLDQPVGLDVDGHGDVVGVVDSDRPDLVVHVEGLVDGRERVVAVVADRPHPQGQVDLRGDPRSR
jgi:hypothetical protein